MVHIVKKTILKVADLEKPKEYERYYNYVRYENDEMTFTTFLLFDGIVEEILTNRSFAILYSRDQDKNIRNLTKYAMYKDIKIIENKDVLRMRKDLFNWDSLYVSSFSEHSL